MRMPAHTLAHPLRWSWRTILADARLRWLFVVTAGALLLFTAASRFFPYAGNLLLRIRTRIAVEQLVDDLGAAQLPAARFSAIPAAGLRSAMRGSAAPALNVEAAAGRIIALTADSSSPESIAATAAALVVKHDATTAITTLEAAIEHAPNEARLWSDLAAAHYEAGHTLQALVAADSALRIDPRSADALHNRALALDQLGLPTVAAESWRDCLDTVQDAGLAAVVRDHLRAAEAIPQKDRWLEAKKELFRVAADDASVDRITKEFPRSVRATGEVELLGQWANAASAGDAVKAGEVLSVLHSVAGALRRRGETFLSDTIAVIDEASAARDSGRLSLLVQGHVAYDRGRFAYKNRDYVTAERELRAAAVAFHAAHSPMENMALAWIASVLSNSSRIDEAHQILTTLIADEQRTPGHRALMAMSEYLLARCNTIEGRWNDAVDAAKNSASLSRTIGETSEAAESEQMLAAILDMLGQQEAGWEYRLRALRATSTSSTPARLLVWVGSASRAAARAHDWELAISLLDVEMSLAAQVRDPLLTADMLTRRVVVQHERHALEDRNNSLARARIAIAMVPDNTERAGLAIDLDTAEAVMVRERDPRRAIELLGRTIAFGRRTNRRFQLPRVLLERGRAYMAGDEDSLAWQDFSAAMDELEAQRSAIPDIALRSRMLNTAEDLFNEAIAFQVRRGNAEEAFRVAERARARSLLDVLSVDARPVASSAVVASRLPAGTLLVEYAVLPKQLVIFSIRDDGLRMHTVEINSNDLPSRVSEAVLLEPLRDEIAAAANLIIVPDKILQRTAFSSLRWSGQYLVQTHTISETPSASRLVASRPKERSREGSILIVGNPAADPEQNLDALPAVDREIEAISAMYDQAHVLLGSEATKARFVEKASQYDTIHFAGHGISDEESLTAALLFARGGRDLGRMDSSEITQLRLPRSPLVVLDACGTLRGRPVGMEGMPSLARSFIAAGASAVVGTLSDINDDRAASFITSFHRYMIDGASPPEALRAAQIEAIRRGGSAAYPKNWAPFVVYTATP